jgi:predicted acyltransferase
MKAISCFSKRAWVLIFEFHQYLNGFYSRAMPGVMNAPAEPSPKPAGTAAALTASTRLTSVDAYRGLVMFLIMAEVLNFCRVARAIPTSGFWRFLCHHQSHVPWTGCALHDLIQPSFSFLVGVALPFSVAARLGRGQTMGHMTMHAAGRALALVLLGVFLRSTDHHQTYWTFEDTLSQIGLGYLFLFFLAFRPTRGQWLALALLLVGYWAAFAFYPLPGPGFDYEKVGVPANWPHLASGFAAHWNKNSNFAWAFDTWFLNLFPREKPFEFNDGGYATLSFIPTLGTMILGLLAGGVLRSERAPRQKAKWLALAGILGMAAGAAVGWLGFCPVVKRIWTPSWTLYSGGWCFLLLAAFYVVVDIWNYRAWAFPLVVIGMNSIAAYCSDHLFGDFIYNNLTINLGEKAFRVMGNAYEPLLHGAAALLVSWLLLFWLYRRKIFLKI